MLTDKTERKLEYFADTMHHIVETKKREAKHETTLGLSKMAAEALAHASKRHKISFQTKQDEVKRKANKHIAKAKVRAMSAYVQTRHDQIDRLFMEIEATLAVFTQGASYERYLLEHIKHTQTISNFSIIQLSPQDMRLQNTIEAATGLTPEVGNGDFIGGFILLNKTRSIQMDCTLKTRLMTAKKEFAYDTES